MPAVGEETGTKVLLSAQPGRGSLGFGGWVVIPWLGSPRTPWIRSRVAFPPSGQRPPAPPDPAHREGRRVHYPARHAFDGRVMTAVVPPASTPDIPPRSRGRKALDVLDDRLGITALQYPVPEHANNLAWSLGGVTAASWDTVSNWTLPAAGQALATAAESAAALSSARTPRVSGLGRPEPRGRHLRHETPRRLTHDRPAPGWHP
jgi:hypothetical protein